MRRFVMSDIHGSFTEMMALFEYAKFDPVYDQLVIAGDLINRGPDSGKVLKEVKGLEETYDNVHVTIGNHEEMMLWYLDQKHDMWVYFGGKQTSLSINESFQHEGVGGLIDWVRSLPITFEDDKYIYAHAGIELPYRNRLQNRSVLWQSKKTFYSQDPKLILTETKGKPVVHGHTPGSSVTFDGARIAIDLGAQVTKTPKLALVELEKGLSYVYNFKTEKIVTQMIKCI